MVEVRLETDGVTVIQVSGDVDLDTHAAVEDAILTALRSGAGPIVVDLAAVPFLDSSGVRTLLHGRQEAIERQTTLTVRGARPIVARVLRLTNVADILGLPAS